MKPYLILEGCYIPAAADSQDDGHRGRTFPGTRMKFDTLPEVWEYVAEVTGGNRAAVLSMRIVKVRETRRTVFKQE
jgi:hypothetical protein